MLARRPYLGGGAGSRGTVGRCGGALCSLAGGESLTNMKVAVDGLHACDSPIEWRAFIVVE